MCAPKPQMKTPNIEDWPFPEAGIRFQAGDRSFVETTEDAYTSLLGAVPPLRYQAGAFLVGEAECDNERGCPLFSALYRVDGRIFCRYETVLEFESHSSPGLIRAQIAQGGAE